jgi:hypothetical protein
MTQNKKLGFGDATKLNVRTVLGCLPYPSLGVIAASLWFLFTQEIPEISDATFIVIIYVWMILILTYVSSSQRKM